MARLTLSPNDITALVKQHPDVELELISKATEQVADALSRKVTRSLVENRVGELMERLLTEQVGWNQRKLAPALQTMVETGVRTASEQIFNDVKNRKIMEAVRIEAVRQVERTASDLAESLRKEIRVIIRDEIRTMLVGKEG